MSNRQVAFSYSRLNAYEECPKKFHTIQIQKAVKESESPQMAEGKATHKALELRVKRETPLPSHLSKYESMMLKLLAGPGEKYPEQQLAINSEFQPVDWFSKDAWCRSIVDLSIVNGPRAVLFDYKTGKMLDDFTQMKLTGAVFMQHYPQVEEVQLVYLWLKEGKPTKDSLKREQIPDVWSELWPKISRYQQAFAETNFPARPGRYCRWCPVKACPYQNT